MTSTIYYPPPKFYFSVGVLGSGSSPSATVDSSFQEVSGIEVEYGVEEVAEGGENRFAHRLPNQAKYPPLVCKRGVVTKDSPLADWMADTLSSTLSVPIVPQNLLVTLLGADGAPIVAWAFSNAWPLKWKTDPLSSLQNEILTESLEFAYDFFLRTTIPSASAAQSSIAALSASLT